MASEVPARDDGTSCQSQQPVEAPAAASSDCQAGATRQCTGNVQTTAQPTGMAQLASEAASLAEFEGPVGAEALTPGPAMDCTSGKDAGASVTAEAPTGEKECSTCGATRTPMWRNDSSGNKTLCNACGVRLQRQQNKAKSRQAQQEASQCPGGRLAEGKLPRARTSPAKLSLRINFSRSHSQESLAGSLIPLNVTAARNASHRDAAGGSPSPPVKRKSGSENSLANAARSAEQKRMRNPTGAAGTAANRWGRLLCSAVRNVDLLVPAKEAGGKHRITGVVALLEELGRPDQMLAPGARYQHPEGGRAHCALSIFTADKQRVAMCSNPGLNREASYVAEYGGLVWESPARWSLVFTTQQSYTLFKALMHEWISWLHQNASQLRIRSPDQQPGSSLRTGFSAVYRCDTDDATFLEYVNSVQSQQFAQQPEAAVADHKSVQSPLTAQTFERLIDAFEMVSARAGMTEGLPLRAAAALCERCAWAPNKAVGMAVYSYWTNKRNARNQQPLVPVYWQKASPQPLTPPSVFALQPHPSLSRSFSASPPLTLPSGSSVFAPLDSNLSELTAWNAADVPSSAHSKRAESVASDDSAQLMSLFSPEVASANGPSPTRPSSSAALPSLRSLSDLKFPASTEFQLDSSLLGDLPPLQPQSPAVNSLSNSLSQPMAWSHDGSLIHQRGANNDEMGATGGNSRDRDMLDPLDPAFLAGIHDPRESRESRPADTEELSDQTCDLVAEAAQRLGLAAAASARDQAAADTVGEDEMGGFLMLRPPGVSSEGAQVQNAQHGALRRVMSAVDTPETMLRSGSPATPTSKNNLRLRGHASLDFSAPRHLFPDIYAPNFAQSSLTAAERGEDPLGKLFEL